MVVALGLIGPKWRQPIYYEYDTNMSKDLMNKLTEQMEHHGFPVHAVCCNMAGSNHDILGTLGITKAKAYFVNPVDIKRKVHFFCDVPHLVILIRNNLLDHDIRTPSGMVSKESLCQLVI